MAVRFIIFPGELFAMCCYLEVRFRGGGVAGQSINQWMIELWLANSPSLAGPGHARSSACVNDLEKATFNCETRLLATDDILDRNIQDERLLGLLPDLMLLCSLAA